MRGLLPFAIEKSAFKWQLWSNGNMRPTKRKIDRLLVEIRSESRSTCIDAAFQLSKIKDQYVVASLVNVLGDPKPLVRSFAAFALGEVGSSKECVPLGSLLNDPDIGVRVRAASALGKIGDATCAPMLADALRASMDVDAHLCRQIIVALADIGETSAVEFIVPALQSRLPEVRAIAAHFLGYLGNLKSKPYLNEALKHERDASALKAIESALADLDDN